MNNCSHSRIACKLNKHDLTIISKRISAISNKEYMYLPLQTQYQLHSLFVYYSICEEWRKNKHPTVQCRSTIWLSLFADKRGKDS